MTNQIQTSPSIEMDRVAGEEKYPADEVLESEQKIAYAYDAALRMIADGYSISTEEAEQQLISANETRNSQGTPRHLFDDFNGLEDFSKPFTRENATSLKDELSIHTASSCHIPLFQFEDSRIRLIQNYTCIILDMSNTESFELDLHSQFYEP